LAKTLFYFGVKCKQYKSELTFNANPAPRVTTCKEFDAAIEQAERSATGAYIEVVARNS